MSGNEQTQIAIDGFNKEKKGKKKSIYNANQWRKKTDKLKLDRSKNSNGSDKAEWFCECQGFCIELLVFYTTIVYVGASVYKLTAIR